MFRRSQALLNQIFSTTSSSKSPSKISSIGAKSFSTKTRGLGAKIAGSQKVPEAMVSRSEASGDAKTKNTAEGFEEERIRMLRERITRVNAKGGLRYIEKGEEDYVLRGGAGEAKTALPHDPHVPIVPGERYSFHRKDAVSGEVLVKLPANLTFEEFTRDFKWFMVRLLLSCFGDVFCFDLTLTADKLSPGTTVFSIISHYKMNPTTDFTPRPTTARR